jgi:hypothetical protein
VAWDPRRDPSRYLSHGHSLRTHTSLCENAFARRGPVGVTSISRRSPIPSGRKARIDRYGPLAGLAGLAVLLDPDSTPDNRWGGRAGQVGGQGVGLVGDVGLGALEPPGQPQTNGAPCASGATSGDGGIGNTAVFDLKIARKNSGLWTKKESALRRPGGGLSRNAAPGEGRHSEERHVTDNSRRSYGKENGDWLSGSYQTSG